MCEGNAPAQESFSGLGVVCWVGRVRLSRFLRGRGALFARMTKIRWLMAGGLLVGGLDDVVGWILSGVFDFLSVLGSDG